MGASITPDKRYSTKAANIKQTGFRKSPHVRMLPSPNGSDQYVLTLTTRQAGVSRRHVKNFQICFKNFGILEFRDHIWNHHEKCIELSANMPSIG